MLGTWTKRGVAELGGASEALWKYPGVPGRDAWMSRNYSGREQRQKSEAS